MDARHTGNLRFDSPFDTFSKFKPTLSFAVSPSSYSVHRFRGQTVRPHLATSTEPVDNPLGGESEGWTICKVVHPSRSNRLVDNLEVEETTMNRFFNILFFNLYLVSFTVT